MTDELDLRAWSGHVIVAGLGDIGIRVIEQLRAIGVAAVALDDNGDPGRIALLESWGVPHVVRVAHSSESLLAAGLAGALAVVCAEETDLQTLEVALLVRDLRPEVRIVVHLDNPAVGQALESVTGDGGVLDVAGLFAPSVVDTCLGKASHELELAGQQFVAVEVEAPRLGSLRELYGDLAPVGVVTRHDDGVIVCPGRDQVVVAGDRVTMLGTEAQIAAAGLSEHLDVGEAAANLARRLLNRFNRALQGMAEATDRAVRATLVVGALITIASTLILHVGYVLDGGGRMNLLEAFYFTMETGATVGFGDFSFAAQSDAMQVFGIGLIVAGTTLVSLLFALVTNALVSRRIEQSLGRGRLVGIADHTVVVGLGAVGMRVLEGLVAAGHEAVAIERDEHNRYIAQARALGVPVVVGDATLPTTLDAVHIQTAAAAAVMTSNDLVNLETGLALRDALHERWFVVPVILRVFDRALGGRLEGSFGFRHVWSTSAIAAPWFVGAAVGFGVVATFYVGNVPFLVGRLGVSENGGLAGLEMR
ncbi:MAG TPA: NAD-binding protein, partial [Solirubrobacteraceae bacterium]|nr:NAD-binding protein [Solirubrobacteraceae bacterium]